MCARVAPPTWSCGPSTSPLVRMASRSKVFCISFTSLAILLGGCGARHGRNVYGDPSDERLLTRCVTGRGVTFALYVNEGGGPAVGVSYSVTAEQKPQLLERQIMYSDYLPEFTALSCTADGFDLTTSAGLTHVGSSDIDALRTAPRNLGEEYRRAGESNHH